MSMIWNTNHPYGKSLAFADSADNNYRAWRIMTPSGKAHGRVVYGLYTTSLYAVHIPACTVEEFEERVQAVFAMKPTQEHLVGRPRWNEFVNNTKALDVAKLRKDEVIRLKGVATWFADNLNGRFNQNAIKIHGFRDSKIQELYPYMKEGVAAECTKFVNKPFNTTATFDKFINAVKQNLNGCIAMAYNEFVNAKMHTAEQLKDVYVCYCEDWRKEFGIIKNRIKKTYTLDEGAVRKFYNLPKNAKISIKELTRVNLEPLTDAQIAKDLEMFRQAIA